MGKRKEGGSGCKNNTGGQQQQVEKVEGEEGEQPSRKKVKCFNCGEDHYINNCPEFLEFKKSREENRQATATWDASTFVTYQVNAIGINGFKATEVLLDNQANISIMRPELLRAFEHIETETEIRVNGVGGVQLCTNETGYLQDFFRVYTSPDTKANVLSFADAEDILHISHKRVSQYTYLIGTLSLAVGTSCT
jgi:hypothetical protein